MSDETELDDLVDWEYLRAEGDGRETLSIRGSMDDETDLDDLIDWEYMRMCAAEGNPAVTIDQVREALSSIRGSMDDAINETRGDY